MDETTKTIRDFYNNGVEGEWNRIAGRPEFILTCRMLDRYIKPGETILDVGGGPGRYSIYLAKKGCNVTLLDLSPENVKFAATHATEQKLVIKTEAGDAREADKIIDGQFDHVLLMGPMYHLLDETERIKAVNAALSLLKLNGLLFVSFINTFAGIIYYMKDAPDKFYLNLPDEQRFIDGVIEKKSFGGQAFTKAFFIEPSEILPFFERFPLEKLHLFGQEGITAPLERNIMSQSAEVVERWLGFAEKLWEREDLLNYSEHLMYVGRKR